MRVKQLEPQKGICFAPDPHTKTEGKFAFRLTGGLHDTTLNLLLDTGCSPQGPCYFPRVRELGTRETGSCLAVCWEDYRTLTYLYTILRQTSETLQHPTAPPKRRSATKLIHAIQRDFYSLLSIFTQFRCAFAAKAVAGKYKDQSPTCWRVDKFPVPRRIAAKNQDRHLPPNQDPRTAAVEFLQGKPGPFV